MSIFHERWSCRYFLSICICPDSISCVFMMALIVFLTNIFPGADSQLKYDYLMILYQGESFLFSPIMRNTLILFCWLLRSLFYFFWYPVISMIFFLMINHFHFDHNFSTVVDESTVCLMSNQIKYILITIIMHINNQWL